MNDPNIWDSFRRGDEAAFSRLYQEYVEVLYKYGHRITGDTDLIEDAIQDLFIELWRSRQRLSDTDSVKYYLFRVLRRKITQNPLAKNRTTFDSQNVEPSDACISAENELIDQEMDFIRKKVVAKVLLELPPRQQEVVNLRYFHSFDHQQIAEIMNISLQSVHNTLQKSMKNMRRILFDNYKIILPIIELLVLTNIVGP